MALAYGIKNDQPSQQPVDLSILYTPHFDYYLLNLNCSLGGCQRFEISAIFRVSRSGEVERLANCGVPGNHHLLWHGTKTANMMGILQQGLRIAPPEASRSGWSLGKVSDSVISVNFLTCTRKIKTAWQLNRRIPIQTSHP